MRCRGGVTPSRLWKKAARARPALWELDDEDSDSHLATGEGNRRRPDNRAFSSSHPSNLHLPRVAAPDTTTSRDHLARAQSSHPARTQPFDTPRLHKHLFDRDTLMPGLLSPLSASGTGAVAGMKRPHEHTSVPTYGQPHPKKAKVSRQLHHTQPVAHLVEPLGGGFGASGDQEFIHTQLRRAIAIQCRGIGFASARPEAVESMVGLVDECMD